MANKILSASVATATVRLLEPFFIGRDYASTVLSMEPIAYVRLGADPGEFSSETGLDAFASYVTWPEGYPTSITAPIPGQPRALNFATSSTQKARLLVGQWRQSADDSLSFWAKQQPNGNASSVGGHSTSNVDWTHVAISGGRRYDNGVDVGAATFGGYDLALSGSLAEVAVFDRPLTSTEITALYQSRSTVDEWDAVVDGSKPVVTSFDWVGLGGSADFGGSQAVELGEVVPAESLGFALKAQGQVDPLFEPSNVDQNYLHVEVRDAGTQGWVSLTVREAGTWLKFQDRNSESLYFIADMLHIGRNIDAIRFRGTNAQGGARGTFQSMEYLRIDVIRSTNRFAGRASAQVPAPGLTAGKSRFPQAVTALATAALVDPGLLTRDVIQIAWIELILPAAAVPQDAIRPAPTMIASASAPAPAVGAQRVVTISGALATAQASALAPSSVVSRETVTVAGETALASTTAVAPDAVVTGISMRPGAATASVTAPAPTVSSQEHVTITGATGLSTANAIAPAVSLSRPVAGEVATASATALAPAIVTTSSALVTPGPLTATVAGRSPIIIGGSAGSISPPPALAEASASAPAIVADMDRIVAAEAGTASVQSPSPALALGMGVIAPAATSAAQAHAPVASLSSIVGAPVATATAGAPTPVVGLAQTVEAPTSGATAAMLVPGVTATVSEILAVATATASAQASAPSVSVGTGLVVPVAKAVVAAKDPALGLGVRVQPQQAVVAAEAKAPTVSVVRNPIVSAVPATATAETTEPFVYKVAHNTVFGRPMHAEATMPPPVFEFTVNPEAVDAEILLFRAGTGDTAIGSTSSDVRLGSVLKEVTSGTT